MNTNNTSTTIERILSTLLYIQTHLTDDLELAHVAEQAALSPFYFHRLFQEVTGETLKKYTQRLRLERAAFEMKIYDISILDLALKSGYRSHETFSRAFKRQFGLTPISFRQATGRLLTQSTADADNAPESLNKLTTVGHISDVRIEQLAPLPLAFIRHLGDYVDVDLALYDRLHAWTRQRGVNTGDNLLIGIGHDDPSITAAENVRFDACIQVPDAFEPDGEIGFQRLPAGQFATVTYIGPYGASMYEAYAAIYASMFKNPAYQIVGLPTVEIYRTSRLTPTYELNETDIFVPVIKRTEIN